MPRHRIQRQSIDLTPVDITASRIVRGQSPSIKGTVITGNPSLAIPPEDPWVNPNTPGTIKITGQRGKIGRFLTGQRYSRKRVFDSGGWFRRNLGSIATTAMGGASMFIPGMQGTGASLLGAGVTGILAGNREPESPTTQMPGEDNWMVNRRHHNLNTRSMRRSLFLATGGSMGRVSKLRPDPMSVQQAPGGQMEQVSSNAMIAHGNTHEQGGINLPGGEVEDNETLVQSPYSGDTNVHSDELGYAEEANRLAELKGQVEQELQQKVMKIQTLDEELAKISYTSEDVKDRIKRNQLKREAEKIGEYKSSVENEIATLEGRLAQLDQAIESNFQTQELHAQTMGMRDDQGVPADGGDMYLLGGRSGINLNLGEDTTSDIDLGQVFGDQVPGRASFLKNIATEGTPFISNLYNMFAGRRLDSLPAPQRERQAIPTMDSEVNVSPQMRDIHSTAGAEQEFIRGNVGAAPTARASFARSRAGTLDATGRVHSQAENLRRQITGRNLEVAAGIDARNIEGDYANQMFDFQRRVSGIERDSANIANIENKLVQRIGQERFKDYQQKQADLLALTTEGTSIHNEIMASMGKQINVNTIKDRLQQEGLDPNSNKFKQIIKKVEEYNKTLRP